MTAKYRIKDTFKITGRGLVLAGYIEVGEISVGDYIEFTTFDKKIKRKIIGVEGFRKANPDQTNTGLLIQCEDEREIDELTRWRPKGDIGLVTKST
jgi:translation elongation factor EF-Tu-like GTPase